VLTHRDRKSWQGNFLLILKGCKHVLTLAKQTCKHLR
jgi:hypothetical protein